MKLSKKCIGHLLTGTIATTAITTVTSGIIGTYCLINYFASGNKDPEQLYAAGTSYAITIASGGLFLKLVKLRKESLEDELPSPVGERYDPYGRIDRIHY